MLADVASSCVLEDGAVAATTAGRVWGTGTFVLEWGCVGRVSLLRSLRWWGVAETDVAEVAAVLAIAVIVDPVWTDKILWYRRHRLRGLNNFVIFHQLIKFRSNRESIFFIFNLRK